MRKNIGFGLAMRGMAKAEADRRIDEAIALVRLQQQEHKLPGQLSGGQQQRVAIARAIVVEPPLVLMDEPLSNLDAKLRLEMRAEIRRIHNTLGSTTIYVTHDQEEALSLADRIVVMRDGEVRQVGTPEDLYARPDHLDVAEFMGFRNRIAGRVVALDGDVATIDAGQARIAGRVRGSVAARRNGAGCDPARRSARAAARRRHRGHRRPPPSFAADEFVGFGRAATGRRSVVSRAVARSTTGATVHVGADAERVLVYAEPPS